LVGTSVVVMGAELLIDDEDVGWDGEVAGSGLVTLPEAEEDPDMAVDVVDENGVIVVS
jgi:hypothetical protein